MNELTRRRLLRDAMTIVSAVAAGVVRDAAFESALTRGDIISGMKKS